MSEILKRLREIRNSADGMSKGTVMGNGPHPWVWIRAGDFNGGRRLGMTDEEASRELNDLIRRGEVLAHVRKDELLLELPPEGSPKLYALTTEQLKKLVDAVGDDKDWPKMTDDPQVNYVVDCLVGLKDDDEDAEYDEELYVREAEAFKARRESERASKV